MSGRFVYTPEPSVKHQCSVPQVSLKDFSRLEGSVAQCDCGLTWVLGTSPASGMYPWWNAEGWFARQRREHRRRKEIARRRARYEQGANPDGIVLLADVHPLGGDLESDLPPSAAIKPPGRPVSWVVQWDDAEETVIVLGPGLPFPMLDVQNGESQDVRKALAHEVARRLNSEPLPTGLVHVPRSAG